MLGANNRRRPCNPLHVVLLLAAILVCSNMLVHSHIRQCPPSHGATNALPQLAAADAPAPPKGANAPNDHHQATPPASIVPAYCDSPFRGHFDKIYASGKWFNGQSLRSPDMFYSDAGWPPKDIQRASASGPGSNRGSTTETSMKVLKGAIAKYKVTSMIDIPCGDVNWIFDSFETDTLPLYIGLDISFGVITVNKRRFGHHSNKQFHVWDATDCPLPKFVNGTGDARSADLVHARDVVQHMTLDQGVRFFCNALRSGARALITTTFEGGRNRNVGEGSFYENDLSSEPFSFPTGECVPTHPEHERDLTCVYDLGEAWATDFLRAKC